MLAGLHARFASRFVRSEPRGRALAYMRGLIAPLERKNGWTLAERAGDRLPIGMQRLLGEADWDAEAVRDDVRDYVVETIGDKGAVLIGDDTGFLKKGVRSAGVQRQYSGTAGRTENCQVGTFLAYASPKGRALIDRELYLPASWTDDRERCRDAGIPDEVYFATKTEHFKAMLVRAVEAGVPFAWVTADEAYGQSKSLRCWMEQRSISHVMCVKTSDTVITRGMGERRVDDLVAGLAPQSWKRLSAGKGSHGERMYQWARIPIRIWWENGHGHWVLARRSLKDPTDIAYYVCYGPAGTRMKDLVRVAGARWAVEECFQTAKGECGLDHYQVRLYHAWYRHITLAMAALAALAAVRAHELSKGETAVA
ncbi:IS701 family transposase [Streptomyces sp. NBC_00513]|uniref:IS701 family transposase n=1 Tax=unclassified Streptomyces TaxID=2593676 RepID=UPI002254398F|nr:IS701 family transposase [Streptomyces sp. NBC_00424]MCX5079032.1 IS701 family transposase [Streptomyces sp. NBC_00424]MCX5079158.1 IS701 family transposase [Streptomyces sp. NBC_00424]WUD39279.1 IS701 family transposase [Streptomyces sp. NBC_00513]